MSVWITGAAGMLGQQVMQILESEIPSESIHIVGTDREVDIANRDAVSAFLASHPGIEWIVNCAAWTAVDAAEENAEAARTLNVEGPRVLALAAAANRAGMVHISTDYVFAGTGVLPYKPDDPTDPRSVYGITKRDGEIAVRDALARHVIFRTAWLFGAHGRNFVSTMVRLMNERDEIGVVADQFGLPTYAVDLAAAIARVVLSPPDDGCWGTYHFTNAPDDHERVSGISWHQFAEAIYEAGRKTGAITSRCTTRSLTTNEYPTPATRPAYSVLNCDSTVSRLGVRRPRWRDALQRYFAESEGAKP